MTPSRSLSLRHCTVNSNLNLKGITKQWTAQAPGCQCHTAYHWHCTAGDTGTDCFSTSTSTSICYVWQGNRLLGGSLSGSASFLLCAGRLGPPPIGGALLASAGAFAIYQHNQPLPVVVTVMSLVVVWVWLCQ